MASKAGDDFANGPGVINKESSHLTPTSRSLALVPRRNRWHGPHSEADHVKADH